MNLGVEPDRQQVPSGIQELREQGGGARLSYPLSSSLTNRIVFVVVKLYRLTPVLDVVRRFGLAVRRSAGRQTTSVGFRFRSFFSSIVVHGQSLIVTLFHLKERNIQMAHVAAHLEPGVLLSSVLMFKECSVVLL